VVFKLKLTVAFDNEQNEVPEIAFVTIPLGLAIVKKSSLLSNNVPETVLALTLQILEMGALMVQLYTLGVSGTLFNSVVHVASLSVV
jgi:hypothetical protein